MEVNPLHFGKKRVLVTGAAGLVGQLVIAHLADKYELILTDSHPLPKPSALPFVKADISDPVTIRPLCQGIDTVLHLATANMHAPWEELLTSNIVGTYKIFHLAQEMGCRRVVFASSVQVVQGAPQELVLTSDAVAQPNTLYGVTKAWGEALGNFIAYQSHMSIICLRLGWVIARNNPALWPGSPDLKRAITHEDLISLLVAAVDAPTDIRFTVLNGSSDNRQKRLDIEETRRLLDYSPQDDSFALAQQNYPTFLHRGLLNARFVANRMRSWIRKGLHS